MIFSFWRLNQLFLSEVSFQINILTCLLSALSVDRYSKELYDFVYFFCFFVVRLCFVEARGTYKKANKFCPILSEKQSNIECVIGLDRLDCLRRIHKGTAHFGVFSSEDLITAEWADVDVLITSEMRFNESLYLFAVFICFVVFI